MGSRIIHLFEKDMMQRNITSKKKIFWAESIFFVQRIIFFLTTEKRLFMIKLIFVNL
jgi:hypothetical protein